MTNSAGGKLPRGDAPLAVKTRESSEKGPLLGAAARDLDFWLGRKSACWLWRGVYKSSLSLKGSRGKAQVVSNKVRSEAYAAVWWHRKRLVDIGNSGKAGS